MSEKQAALTEDEELELLELEEEEIKIRERERMREAAKAQAEANKATDERPFQMDQAFITSLPQAGASMARSALEGFTLGASEPVVSGVKAIGQHLIGDEQAQAQSAIEDIKKKYLYDRELRRAEQAYNPGLDITGEAIGGLAPSGAGYFVAKNVLKGMKALEEAAQLGKIAAKAPRTAEIAKGALEGAAIGATVPRIQEGVEVASGFLKPEEMASYPAQVGTGAALGAGLTALPIGVGMSANALGKGADWVKKKAIQSAFGVPEEAVSYYTENPELVRKYINAARGQDGVPQIFPQANISEQISEVTDPFREKAKQAALKKVQAKDARQQAQEEYRYFLEDAKQKAARAEADVKETYKNASLPYGFKDDVEEAVKDLSTKLSDESAKSYSILEAQDGNVDLSDMFKFVKDRQISLYTRNQLLNDPKKRAFSVLQEWKELFKGLKKADDVTYPEVKQIVQDMDMALSEIQAKKNAGQFDEIAYKKLMEVRQKLDEKLKVIPEFRDQMKVVKYLWDLKDKAGQFLGRPGSDIQSKLNAAWKPESKTGEFLTELATATGRGWTQDLADFAAKRQMAASPSAMKNAINSHPDVMFAQRAEMARRFPGRADFGAFDVPPEFTAWMQTEQDYLATSEALKRAEAELKALGPLARDGSNFGPVRKVMMGKDPAYMGYLKELSAMTGQDFEREVKAARTAELMSMDHTRGSRGVNLAGFMGGGLGAYVGKDPVAGMIMQGMFAPLGAINDKYGSRIAQKFLDLSIKLNETKQLPKVKDLLVVFKPLPSELRRQIVGDFVQSVTAAIPENYEIPVQMRGPAASMIQADQSLTTIEKAKAKLQIERDGIVHSSVVQKMMLQSDHDQDVRSEMLKRVFKETSPRR